MGFTLYFAAIGIFFILVGAQRANMPLDALWLKQERTLRQHGLSSQRTAEWESNVASSSRVLMRIGCAFVLLSFVIPALLSAITPKPMSGMIVNGRELTKAEAETCGYSPI